MKWIAVTVCLVGCPALAQQDGLLLCSHLGDSIESDICECAKLENSSVERLDCFDAVSDRVVAQEFFLKAMIERVMRYKGGREAMERALRE